MNREKAHLLLEAAWDANESQKKYEVQIMFGLDAFDNPKVEIVVFLHENDSWTLVECKSISKIYGENTVESGLLMISKYKEAGLNDTVPVE